MGFLEAKKGRFNMNQACRVASFKKEFETLHIKEGKFVNKYLCSNTNHSQQDEG